MNTAFVTQARWILLIISLIFHASAHAQLRISDFSKLYYATIEPSADAGGEALYDIVIYANHLKKPILVQTQNELSEYDFENKNQKNEVIANIVERPYGHQSVLLYKDFNFDGKEDLALKDGNFSCYGGPSFQVYLANATGGFDKSEAFTELAQTQCGMFEVDSKAQQLHTMTKSGCCWHEYSSYGIVKNQPSLIERTIESVIPQAPSYLELTEFTFDRNPKNPIVFEIDDEGKYSSEVQPLKKRISYHLVGSQSLFSFKLKHKDKTAIIMTDGDFLDYALVDVAQKVEFSAMLSALGYLPYSKKRQNAKRVDYLTFYPQGKSRITLKNSDVSYTFIDEVDKLGIEVSQRGKKTFLAGEKSSKQGGLSRLYEPAKGAGSSDAKPLVDAKPLIETLANVSR